jgi:hypothetical protein
VLDHSLDESIYIKLVENLSLFKKEYYFTILNAHCYIRIDLINQDFTVKPCLNSEALNIDPTILKFWGRFHYISSIPKV